MAKHTGCGQPNKNLLMHIRNNHGYSGKVPRKCTEDNAQPGCTDDSQHHLKYMLIAQCKNLKQTMDDLRNDQTEIVKKLEILESRTCTAMAGCKYRLSKQISVHEEASSSASSTLADTSGKRDSGLAERSWMLEQLRRMHTSFVNDNRITYLENKKNVIASKTQSFVYFSNVQHFRTILSASEQHGDGVDFQDISMGATSEYKNNLDVRSGSHKRKPQARQLRQFKTDTKEDNRIVSYEAQIEHARDKKNSQNRTQAEEVTRHSQDYHSSTKPHKNKTEMNTEMSSTEESMTKPWVDASKDLMPKSSKMSTEYSVKGAQTRSFDESTESTASLMGAVASRPKSRLQVHGHQFEDSVKQFRMKFDEEQINKMMKSDGAMDLMPAFRTQLQTMMTEDPELLEHIQNMSALPFMHSSELEFSYLAEYEEAKKHREPGNSVETIICLDTSESMKGSLWTKAITFAKNFIQEVKNQPCGDSAVFERIGLVTFGHVPRVQVHLTRHYHQVLSKLDTLSPSGPTPMMLGLKLCAVAIEGGGGGNLQMNKMNILPRIILITDGKTTSPLFREGPDFSINQDQDEELVMNTVEEIKKGCQAHIDCVPLGESKIDFLTKIAQTTRGKIYHCEDWKKLGRRTKYLNVASQLYQEFQRTGRIDLIRNVIRTYWNVKGEDVDIIEESMRRSEESTEEKHFSGERINRLEDQLLLIGTRVRRGPDWQWGDQDSHGVGTVIGYDKNNWISVVWDNYDSRGRNSNMYRYAVGGNFDVMPVEEPRLLSPGERIAVGCKVKRGKDWTSGDQDGGSENVGTVIETGDRSEEVMVRWPNRKSHKYKFGKKGKYEIQLCDTHESYTSNIMAEKETESVEGKLWKEIDRQKVEQKVKDIDVEEMNRRNIEMSKCYITLPNSGGSVKESSGLKPKDSKVKMDTEVTMEYKNTKQNKNR